MTTPSWNGLFDDAEESLAEHLIDGQQVFRSYVEAIETAISSEHYIYITGWMLDAEFPLVGTYNPAHRKAGQYFFRGDKKLRKLLEAAAKNGVELRGLVWHNPLYLKTNAKSIVNLNKLPNAKFLVDDNTFSGPSSRQAIASVEPQIKQVLQQAAPLLLSPAARIKDPHEVLYLAYYYLQTKNVGSHHEKLLIVNGKDGLIAFCGGLDINNNRFTAYHDTACRLMGPAAHGVLAKFVKRWQNHPRAKSVSLRGSAHVKPVPLPKSKRISEKKQLRAKVVGTYNSPDGKDRDRSVRAAYLDIVAKARNYIYIEDQYLVNLDVAKVLNGKLKGRGFKKLIVVIQDSRETADIMIPDRKRGEFVKALLDGTTAEQRRRFDLFMVDDISARSSAYHPGVHAKTLIVDDTLALIGSANVNQRSFTLDSETSVVVFNNKYNYYRNNFAYKMRQALWRDFVVNTGGLRGDISWEEFSRNVKNPNLNYSRLIRYRKSVLDLDENVANATRKWSVPGAIVLSYTFRKNPQAAVRVISSFSNPVVIRKIFDTVWDTIIDPTVP